MLFRPYWVRQISLSDQVSQVCGSDHAWLDLWFRSYIRSDLPVRSVFSSGYIKSPCVRFACRIRLRRTLGSDHIWSDMLFRSYIGSHQMSSGTLESSHQVGSAGQLTLWWICLSDQVKSKLWFRSYFGRMRFSDHSGSDLLVRSAFYQVESCLSFK